MPAAGIGPVDDDVATLSLADGIATARHDGWELDAASAARILDIDRERLRGKRRLRVSGPASCVRSTGAVASSCDQRPRSVTRYGRATLCGEPRRNSAMQLAVTFRVLGLRYRLVAQR